MFGTGHSMLRQCTKEGFLSAFDIFRSSFSQNFSLLNINTQMDTIIIKQIGTRKATCAKHLKHLYHSIYRSQAHVLQSSGEEALSRFCSLHDDTCNMTLGTKLILTPAMRFCNYLNVETKVKLASIDNSF